MKTPMPAPATLLNKRLWPEACNFIKKETLVEVFSCEFCEIFKNTFFTEHPSTTTSCFTIMITISKYIFL